MLQNTLFLIYAIFVGLMLFNLTIFIHELGHYLVGRWRGAKIERFAVWFGPAIWSRTINGVEFRLGCIPLGGYVAFPQLAMEAIEGKSETPAEDLKPLKPKDKIPILFAGSIANVFLGFAVATLVWVVGVPKEKGAFDLHVGYVPARSPERIAGMLPGDEIVSINGKKVKDWDEVMQRVALSLSETVRVGVIRPGQSNPIELNVVPKKDHLFGLRHLFVDHLNIPVVKGVLAASPAEKAGFQVGDEFLEINGEKILSAQHLNDIVGQNANHPILITVLRKGERVNLEVTPKVEKKTGQAMMGVQLDVHFPDSTKITVHPDPLSQVKESLIAMADTLNALVHRKTTGVGVGDLSGPIGIGYVLIERIKLDFRLALSFLVMLNINLAVVNLLPIPVLDGGHIMFSILEAIRRKPLNPKWMEMTQTVFVVLLLGFMLYVSFNDLDRMRRLRALTSDKVEAKTAPSSFEEQSPAQETPAP